MAYTNRATKYLENDILTRPQPWLVPLLYEHAVATLRQLGQGVEARDALAVARAHERVTRIIGELLSSLDVDRGERLVSDLVALYSFLLVEIPAAVRSRDRLAIDRLAVMLSGLQAAWTRAAEQVSPRRVQSA